MKTCRTCKWEPAWIGTPGRGHCTKPWNKRTVQKLGLPPGTNLVMPWVYREKVKQECPAWEPKEEA